MKVGILIFLMLSLVSCKNYYNEMIDWTSSIEIGTDIETVKKMQPEYLEIDWNQPDTFDNEIRYYIKNIKFDYDALKMTNYLVFIDGKYQGRFAHK